MDWIITGSTLDESEVLIFGSESWLKSSFKLDLISGFKSSLISLLKSGFELVFKLDRKAGFSAA